MTIPIARKYQVADKVLIQDPWADTASWPGRITSPSIEPFSFCRMCHCCPADPDHRGDGSICCPGPWYRVTYACPSDLGHEHEATYAEHELLAAP